MSSFKLDRFLPAVTGGAMKKRGFGEVRLLTEWEQVVGPHLARHSVPVKITFESGKRDNGALHVQVSSAMALDFQHLQPLILERIASFFGYRAVARLVLLQMPHLFHAGTPEKKIPAAKSLPGINVEALVSDCEDAIVKESLLNLANTVFATARDSK